MKGAIASEAAERLQVPETLRLGQLDGTRIFAASAVIYAHAADAPAVVGRLGVEYFFVLSGYLITGLLLRARGKGSIGDARPLGNFFVRRCLRIWPAYYLLLAFLFWRNYEHIRDTAGWHLLYGSNVLFWLQNRWDPWIVSHFWSLAVEEQFYLVWPLLIYCTARRVLSWLLPTLAIASWAAAFLFSAHFPHQTNVGLDVLMPFSLLGLGLGATLALWCVDCPQALRALRPAGLLCTAALSVGIASNGMILLESFWARPLTTICFVWFIAALSAQPAPVLADVLSARPLSYLGRISYGVYLYHLLALYYLVQSNHGPHLRTGLSTFLMTWAASIFLASLSWHVIEKPANALKKKFFF